ncbi:MAG: fibronectin type III domain-containing protein, partial [Sandaracinaceae bacterium]|nr:fibronectin type III domain-containing protein [Sandaracinaceae bacterium]
MSTRAVAALLVVLLALATPASAQELHVGPYVQDVTTSSAWILWETTGGEESVVEWGATDALGQSATGGSIPSEGTNRVHEVELTGLLPATRYHYRVRTGAAVSEPFHFTTAPARVDEVTFRLAAMSDMQIDRANPEVYGQVIREGILALLAAEGHALPDDGLGFVLVPGDLVDDGDEYDQWR